MSNTRLKHESGLVTYYLGEYEQVNPIIENHITMLLLKTWNFLKQWKIFIGRSPRELPANAIVIFPVIPENLSCGLAGIVTIKRKHASQYVEAERLAPLFEEIQMYGMKKIITRSIAPEAYLGGLNVLRKIEKNMIRLKEDSVFEECYFRPGEREGLTVLSESLHAFILGEEALLEKNAGGFSTGEMVHINNRLERAKDFSWTLEREILANFDKVCHLAEPDDTKKTFREGFRKFKKINLLLNALERIEVRGRDSAGIGIYFTLKERGVFGNILETLKNKGLYDEFLMRLAPGDIVDGSIHMSDITPRDTRPFLAFIYKKASITGALGENTESLRSKIRADLILRAFINEDTESEMFAAHTRWASVGAINEENCHPINNFTITTGQLASRDTPLPVKEYVHYGMGNWTIHVALNGDIDNYRNLRSSIGANGNEIIDRKVTTDTKIIPLMIEKYLLRGHDLKESFRLALNDFQGSHAIAIQSNLEPGKVFLALRGSGQSLYVGLCEDQYVFSSEIYGIVELTPYFIQIDGENERIPGNAATRGQIFILGEYNDNGKGNPAGISALFYDGCPMEITKDLVRKAEITTRDIDRKDYPHYLLKEIIEAPLSVRKTLRGKYRISRLKDGTVDIIFNLGKDVIPERIERAISRRAIRNICVIGQGTAAVACSAISEALFRYLKEEPIRIEAMTATDFSGFFLKEHMDDTLVIAVTQSGTTTDTNRAVAMARERGAHLIAIVNRRQSDITQKVDGVLYTSDGRDVEMSVASTKAFYAQIMAGYILALRFAQMLRSMPDDIIAEELAGLENAPDMMTTVISARESIRESAWELAKKKKYWAVVGSGPNKVAADEIRIKLSELCYKTISSDVVEDKKHIDLSSEPLIIACTAGNPEPVIADIVKDVAIFKAHAAHVVVFAEEGDERFYSIADSVIPLPKTTYPTSVILNTITGHIWGYYAACSINEEGVFFHNFRNRLSLRMRELDRKKVSLYEILDDTDLHRTIDEFNRSFHMRKNQGFFSSLSAGLAADITLLLKYSVGKLPLEDFWADFEDKRVSSSPFDMLDVSLGRAVDELSRPIDAIRHQAKTVTVGTSRKGEVPHGIIFDFLRDLNFSLENLTSKGGFTARRLQKAISAIKGYTLYRVDNLDDDGKPADISTISIEKRGGVAIGMKSRIKITGILRGTKKTITTSGDIYAGLGKSDKAPIVVIPLLGSDRLISNILLIHVGFKADLSVQEKKKILADRYDRIRDLVTEYNLLWDDRCLGGLSIELLLGEGVDIIAEMIMNSLERRQ